jgi:hypothetical protein
MSKRLFLIPALLFSVFVMFTTSCNTDKCAKKDCGQGICTGTDGVCNCDAGYEKDATTGICTVKSQDKFVGNWLVNETCSNSGSAAPYNVSIAAGASLTDVNITGFYGPAASGGFVAAVKATIDGTTITIARQQPDNDKIYVQGTGTIVTTPAPSKITFSYTVSDETGTTIISNSCNNVIYTKQ